MLNKKRWAVSYVNFYDNELVTEIVVAQNWKIALVLHSKLATEDWETFVNSIPETLEEVKEYFFNADCAIDVVEIPDES